MYIITRMAQLLLFLACSCMPHTLNCSDDDFDFDAVWGTEDSYIESSTGVVLDHKQNNMTVAIRGDGSEVNMRPAEISDTLTIYIMGNNNTVAINHPNRLRLAIRGDNCHVTNLCKSRGTILDIRGKSSTYETDSPLKRGFFASFTNSSFIHIALTLGAVGLLAYIWHKR